VRDVVERQVLASQFLAFCGPERFRKFVLQLHRECRSKGRLLFWQEQLWAEFAATEPGEIPFSVEGIAEALRLCPVHELPLESEEVPIVYGLVRFPPGYVQAREERFPFANEVAYGGCCVGPEERATVLLCEGCRREQRRPND
jgi:hypothetical protein